MNADAVEPTYVGPVAGGHLRASDRDRDQVGTVLSTAYSEGRLTREEYDERLDALLRARTFDDLVGLTRDLVVVATPTPVATASTGYAIDQQPDDGEIDRLIGIFGGAERKGKWRIRRRTQAYAIFGGIDLDLREAVFEAPVIEISGIWAFGGLDIKVPEGVEVRDQTAGIFGGTEVKYLGEPRPGAPVIVLKGVSLFGGVSVKGPKPERKRGGATALFGRSHGRGCGGHGSH